MTLIVAISGVNSVYGLLPQSADRSIVISRSGNYPNNQTRKGFIGKGSMTMALQESQNAEEEIKRATSISEVVRKRLAS